jgi:hypothetical protein
VKARVILVDGPRRGVVIETDTMSRFVVPVPRPIPQLHEFDPPYESTFDQVVYTFSPVPLFGRVIRVGSVRPGRPADPDRVEARVSNAAKDVVTL